MYACSRDTVISLGTDERARFAFVLHLCYCFTFVLLFCILQLWVYACPPRTPDAVGSTIGIERTHVDLVILLAVATCIHYGVYRSSRHDGAYLPVLPAALLLLLFQTAHFLLAQSILLR